MNKIKQRWSGIDHKILWTNSMIGMTLGFIASLVVGTIIGILGINQDNGFSKLIEQIKHIMTYLTPFAIGVGIGYKCKMKPLQIMAMMIGVGITSHSLFIPHMSSGVITWKPEVGIDVSVSKPGDVFGAWIAGVMFIYLFRLIEWETKLDIIIVPLLGAVIGIMDSFYLTYLTSTILVLLEWIINNSIDKKRWLAILLSPIIGLIMGLALSLPTSSAAIAIGLKLHGDAATAAMAATTAQMISFGVMTYFGTGSIQKSLAVGFGTSMLQMQNFAKAPKILLIPTGLSMLCALIAVVTVPLEFLNNGVTPTSGMGSCGLYGQIFTLNDNGWDNYKAWINVLAIQLALPFAATFGLSWLLIKEKGFIKPEQLEI